MRLAVPGSPYRGGQGRGEPACEPASCWACLTSPLFQVVSRLGLDSLSPFNPKERVIE